MTATSVETIDTAGGPLIATQGSWTLNGKAIVRLNDPVVGHGLAPHAGPKMVQASNWFSLDGKGVVRAGDLASCGHPATGQGWFNIA